ncbi:sce7726 family protein [Sorangium sp. So ce204]|uniref:sce7726 family protein n=1 Tax=Sorangium sp. So ce204 TaxID=3133288 RepID=UPI003F615C6F
MDTGTFAKRLAPAALLFRSPFLERAVAGKHLGTLREATANAGLSPDALKRPLCSVLDDIHALMAEHYRCEYVFKNAIANEIHLKLHSPETSAMVGEFRSGDCRADVVIANGTSSAYEIKTDLDSLAKLPEQISAYKRIFDKIYIVASVDVCERLMATIDADIGLLCVAEQLTLRTVRKSASHKNETSPASIFDCLRRQEYVDAIKSHFGRVPDVPNTRIYTECKELFCKLSPSIAHSVLLSALRRRTDYYAGWHLLGKVPRSLNYLCMTISGSSRYISRVESTLLSPCVT